MDSPTIFTYGSNLLSVKDFRGRHDWRPKLDYAVFDSVSLATTFRAELAKHRIIFCAISEAIREYPAVLVPVDDPTVLDDLNTPEDYERLVRDINRDIY